MRTTDIVNNTNNTSIALFVDDVEGGCLVECSSCKNEVISIEKSGEKLNCSKCGKELLYPSYASW
jgi:predicted RNA-binding Zn-ribbon protein involved in translation (DUF1610 family)